MADLFSTDTLNRVVQSLQVVPSFFLDRYFPFVQTDSSEEIHFDVDSKNRRLAPFVSPLVEGQIVEDRGYTTSTFKPAYIKDKRPFDVNRPFKRVMGEAIGGTMSPADRERAMLAQTLDDQVTMLRRRLEVMGGLALKDGSITIAGDKYPTTVVDFGRDSSLEPTGLTSTAVWTHVDSTPMDDLQDWATLIIQKEGARPSDVIMDVAAWKAFREHADVKDRLDTRRVSGNGMELGAITNEGGAFMGEIDGFNIFVYQSWYINDAGSEVSVLDSGRVILTSAQLEGVQHFGAIRDHDANFIETPWWVKSWTQPDPSVRYLMLQSAPLVVPYRVNASLSTTVL